MFVVDAIVGEAAGQEGEHHIGQQKDECQRAEPELKAIGLRPLRLGAVAPTGAPLNQAKAARDQHQRGRHYKQHHGDVFEEDANQAKEQGGIKGGLVAVLVVVQINTAIKGKKEREEAFAVGELKERHPGGGMEEQQHAGDQQQCWDLGLATQPAHEPGTHHHDGEQLGGTHQHPHLHVRREPAEDVQILVGEGKEAVVVPPHRFAQKVLSEREVIEQVLVWNAAVPAHQLGIHPIGAMHHRHGVPGEQGQHQGMGTGKAQKRSPCWGFFLTALVQLALLMLGAAD